MFGSAMVCVLLLGQVDATARTFADERDAETILRHYLAASQPGAMVKLGDWLASFALSEPQVQQLIKAAQTEPSEERRILLWHAIRCARSRAGREFLLKNVAQDAEPTAKVRFVQSLRQLAPFDVPILTALYDADQSTRKAAESTAGEDPALSDEILELATQDVTELAPELCAIPDVIAVPAGAQGLVNVLRKEQARKAKADLLVWIAKNTASDAHRLAAVDDVLDVLEGAHQKRFATEVLAAVKKPEARAALIPRLSRRYAYDPFPLLVDDRETEGVKLATLRGLHMFASSYGYSLTALDHGTETLQYVSQSDPSQAVRESSRRLLHRIKGTADDAAPKSPSRR